MLKQAFYPTFHVYKHMFEKIQKQIFGTQNKSPGPWDLTWEARENVQRRVKDKIYTLCLPSVLITSMCNS